MRREADKARDIAWKTRSHQAQRLQPISKFEIDWKPFQDFGELPEMKDALSRVLSPRHTFPNRDVLGILLEPADMPYCTAWHRDWRDNYGLISKEAWFRDDWYSHFQDINMFNQVNCALYEDSCTWVVPGSHLRRDLSAEAEWYKVHEQPPDLKNKSAEEAERLCLDYCLGMPGSERLYLNAGDFALYRNSLWHMGNYIQYRRRATLHDVVDTTEYIQWREQVNKKNAELQKAA